MTQHVNQLNLPPEQVEKVREFNRLFLKWNQRINLSAARTTGDVDEHIADSVHVVPYLRGSARVIDVGSGGGFPVVIAAVCLPETNFIALEPTHKKHAFLRTVARELELSNLEAIAARVEDHTIRDYDAATSRATFDLAEWLALGSSLVRVDGVVIGFEAIQRDDLPSTYERYPYEVCGKRRSIIIARRHS